MKRVSLFSLVLLALGLVQINAQTCVSKFLFSSDNCPEISFMDDSPDSLKVSGWSYDFGDGYSASVQNPSHTYSADGDYKVCLTVTDTLGQTCQFCDTVTIACIAETCNAAFISASNCEEYSFTDASTTNGTVTDWDYDFGDGTTSTQENPTHSYSENGTFIRTLTISTSGGCSSTFKDTVVISCIPTCSSAFQFNDSNSPEINFDEGSVSSGAVTSWSYDFGDGTTSDEANPTHTYTENGEYKVCLSIVTDEGCSSSFCDTVVIDAIVVPKCNAKFLGSTDNCPIVALFDQSTSETGTITAWSYDFGDGKISTSRNPMHTFTENGTFAVCLTITTSDGCSSTFCDSIKVDCIYVPTCDAAFQYVADNCPSVSFDDYSVSSGTITGWSYSFGDSTSSTEASPTHTYTENGKYEVCLTIETDEDCTSTFCDSVIIDCIVTPKCDAKFLTAEDNCPIIALFDQSTSETGTITGWSYNFGDSTMSISQNPMHTYTKNGKYAVCLTITTSDGCSSTFCDSINVSCIYEPTCDATFEYVADNCPSVSFDDTSVSSGTITGWSYSFGDSIISTDANPTHTYTENGTYEVCLTIETDEGCTSTFCDSIIIDCIVTPECNAKFLIADDNCPIIALFDQSKSETGTITSWKYDFGDGTSSSSRNTMHNYKKNGKYAICLTITTSDSCSSTFCDTLVVDCLYEPTCEAAFEFVDDCPVVSFYDKSVSSGTITKWSYNFGDGATSSEASPSHTYTENGTYEVCLTIETNESCNNVFCDTVLIDCIVTPKGEAKFMASTDNCPIVALFDLSSSETGTVTDWKYDFGDGTISSSRNPMHTYTKNGRYAACLTITTSDGGSFTYCDSIIVDCIYVPTCKADFTSIMDNCPSVSFDDYSVSSGTITSWSYSFGDGQTSTEESPTHLYTENGTYEVCLTIETDEGCSSTLCDSVIIDCIDINTQAGFKVASDNCPIFAFLNQSETKSGNIVSYLYDFGDGNTSDSQNPIHSFTEAGNYQVCLTVTTDEGNTNTYCETVTTSCMTTGIDSYKKMRIEVYPNPVETQLRVKIQNPTEIQYRILGINGQAFDTGRRGSTSNFEIDVTRLASGIYILEVKGNQEYDKIKFIKK